MADKPNNGAFLAVAVIMGTLASLWVDLRISARRMQGISPLLSEDILCYFALVCLLHQTLYPAEVLIVYVLVVDILWFVCQWCSLLVPPSPHIRYFLLSLMCVEVAFLGGAGLHVTQLELNQLDRFSRFVFAAQVLYAVFLGLIKLSIARCLQRIFFIRNFRIAAYVVMGFSVVWTLQAILIAVLICQPVYLNWDPMYVRRAVTRRWVSPRSPSST